MVIRDVVRARAGEIFWLLEETPDSAVVERRDERFAVPAGCYRDVPVPRPSMSALVELEPCFADASALTRLLLDEERYFELLRCKHGRLFLNDTRGGIAMYGRLILVDADMSEASPAHIWAKYHDMSDDWLFHLGIAL